MKDPRIEKLARNLLTHSIKLKKGQTVIIETNAHARELVTELVTQVYQIGAYPFVRLGDEQVSRAIMFGITEDQSKRMCKYAMPLFQEAHAWIGIISNQNAFESADVPNDKKKIQTTHYGRPITDIRVKNLNWVLLQWPSASLAQLCQTSLEAFEDFYFDVCTMDYGKMHEAMLPLQKLLGKTDRVRIVDTDTDLTFSVKGQSSVICAGSHNIPDGEIFTSPIRESVNGKIKFNIPSLHKGIMHNDIALEFQNGRVINANSSNTKELIAELDSDEGARYIGEFAFGVNPYIKKPMNDTLFDEKIAGSIHFALGKCYDDAPNGNESQVHWDIVHIGGEIYFDDILVRKDGKFIPKELNVLNSDKF